MTVGERIKILRKAKKMSQKDLAAKMKVTFQAVSSWETGKFLPEMSRVKELASVLDTTVNDLIPEEDGVTASESFVLKEKLFNEEYMYNLVKAEATSRNFRETLKALPFAKEKHEGQFRKGLHGDKVPYIIHPLSLACQALALGLEDDVIAASLLHDTVEDCNVTVDELPVNDRVKQAVMRVTKNDNPKFNREQNKEMYFGGMKDDAMAMLVKLMDRCNNISNMSMGFSKKKMTEQIVETEKYVMPLFDLVVAMEPGYANACFIVKYHMLSVLEALKRTL